MTNSAPVANFDSSDAKYTQIQAMSSGSPMSPIDVFKCYLRLTVYEKNHAGIRFYERHGFKKIGIKRFPLGKQDRICPILEKEI